MAEFLRPETRAGLYRWREVLAGIAVVALGFWWLGTFYSPVQWIGWVIAVIGVGLAAAGVQRGRFRQSGAGPGVVQIRERRIGYFGPLTGGVMDADDLIRLELEPAALPSAHWILTGAGGQSLAIPVNAAGAEALFDIFAALPRMRTEQMLHLLSHMPSNRITIWSKERTLLH